MKRRAAPLQPPPKSYISVNLDQKRAKNYAYLALKNTKIFLSKGALPLTPQNI